MAANDKLVLALAQIEEAEESLRGWRLAMAKQADDAD